MKIKMLTSMSGPSCSLSNGKEYSEAEHGFSKSEVQNLIEAGFAKPVRAASKKETATKKTPRKETT